MFSSVYHLASHYIPGGVNVNVGVERGVDLKGYDRHIRTDGDSCLLQSRVDLRLSGGTLIRGDADPEPLFAVAALVLFAAVAGALGVAANLARLGLHGPLLIAESAGAGRRMFAVPVGPSGHYYPIVL